MNLLEKYKARLKGVPAEKPPAIIIKDSDLFIEKDDTGPRCNICGEKLVFLRTRVLDEKNKHFLKIPVTANTVRPGDVRFDYHRHEPHRFCPEEEKAEKVKLNNGTIIDIK